MFLGTQRRVAVLPHDTVLEFALMDLQPTALIMGRGANGAVRGSMVPRGLFVRLKSLGHEAISQSSVELNVTCFSKI
jgi:hypothetical protein